jgi:hypothetical protein
LFVIVGMMFAIAICCQLYFDLRESRVNTVYVLLLGKNNFALFTPPEFSCAIRQEHMKLRKALLNKSNTRWRTQTVKCLVTWFCWRLFTIRRDMWSVHPPVFNCVNVPGSCIGGGGASSDTPGSMQSASSQSAPILCVVIFWYICRTDLEELWGWRILWSAIFNAGVHYGSTVTEMEHK